MWYLLHQQADEIIAERHREARRRQLLREVTARSSDDAVELGWRRRGRGRATGARLALATSRLARRLALALDPAGLDPATDTPGMRDRSRR